MFGYVLPCKMELKVKDYERFKTYYCGLCHCIKDIYGEIPRFVLNYDMTFLAILFEGLSSNETTAKKIHCAFHGFKTKTIVAKNDPLNYSAHLNVALTYYKLLDDVNDDKNLKSRLYSLLLLNGTKKFHKDFKDINQKIKTSLKDLHKLEETKSSISLDEIAHPFSDLTGYLISKYPYNLVNDSDELREKLYMFGYNLGKWIYIIDAFDDLKEDTQKNKFNAINKALNKNNDVYEIFKDSINDRIQFTLLNCANKCRQIFLSLGIQKNFDILENIITLGFMEKINSVLDKNNLDIEK